MLPKVYVASPLGFSEAGRDYYNKELLPPIRALNYHVIDPWTLTDPQRIEEAARMPYGQAKREKWQELNQVIAANNGQGIRESNIVCAVLDGTDVDSGTASEIGFATALGIPCIGYRGDLRMSADNEGSTVNLQVEYWINKHGGTILTSLSALLSALSVWRHRLTSL